MKKLIFILFLISFTCKSQIKFDDKVLHYYVGATIAYSSAEILNEITDKPLLSGFVGLGISWGATTTKEFFYDGYLKKGNKSTEDLIVGLFGGAFGSMCFGIKDNFTKNQNKQKQKINNYEKSIY